MRGSIIALGLILSACSGPAQVADGTVRQTLDLPTGAAASPFTAHRGEAAPPPGQTAGSEQTAPPEGQGPAGIDYGRWKSADPAVYGPAFQSQMRTRYTSGAAQARPDLERNGFACRDRSAGASAAVECRIEIMENHCAKEWYVVFESGRREPVAGFDVMCLGANP
ncbi:MAG: hypothetical protein JNJ73_10440 [Hyphomonadaceae bacterium]|nr:hypothetical protein [Hyphomonadaceae bacterium]